MKFVDFTKKWLKEKQGEIKSISLSTYQRLNECYMIPFLGDYETDAITQEVLDEFKIYLVNLGIGETTIGNIMRVTKSMLYPKERISKKVKEEKALDNDELERLVHYLKENPSRINVVLLLAVLTGLGPGELCGIKCKNINFEDNTILINSVVSRINSNSDHVSKTSIIETETTHVRTIKLAQWFMDYLKRITSNNSFYLVTGTKSPTCSKILQYHLKRICKELNINATFKTLQSTFIVNCLESGASLSQIASFLGTTTKQLEMRGYREKEKFDYILDFQEKISH